MNDRQSLWASVAALVVAAGAAGVWTWSLARTPQALAADSAGGAGSSDRYVSCSATQRVLGAVRAEGAGRGAAAVLRRGACLGH